MSDSLFPLRFYNKKSLFHSEFLICSQLEKFFFRKLGHTLNRFFFCNGFIYVQIKYCAIVCNGVGKGFTTGSFRFDQTRCQIFHASPVNFAYCECVK